MNPQNTPPSTPAQGADQNRKADRNNSPQEFQNLLLFLALGLIVAMFTLLFEAHHFPVVDRSDTFIGCPHPWVWGTLLLALIITTGLNYGVGKRSRIKANFRQGLKQGMLGYVLWGGPLFIGLTQLPIIINGVRASSPKQTFQSSVVGKRVKEDSKQGDSYFFDLRDWRQPNQQVHVEVPQPRYEKTNIGDSLEVTTHQGALGYEILDSRF